VTRQTSIFSDLKDEEPYLGVLAGVKNVKSKKEGWSDQLEIDFELRQGGKLRDWMGYGLTTKDKKPSRLRQLLNAIAEKPKATDCWFDADTLEWGYDLLNDKDPAYSRLSACVGMVVEFRGEIVNDRYRVVSYRTAPGGNDKA
jgi:hypothetical protein